MTSIEGECVVCHNRKLRQRPGELRVHCAHCGTSQELATGAHLAALRNLWHVAEKRRIERDRARTDLMRARSLLRAHNIEPPPCRTADAANADADDH